MGTASLVHTAVAAPHSAGLVLLRIARPVVNLRSGPGTNYSIVEKATQNKLYKVIGRNAAGDWYNIALATDGTAWVYASIVTVHGPVQDVPVTHGATTEEATTNEATTSDTAETNNEESTAAPAPAATATPTPTPPPAPVATTEPIDTATPAPPEETAASSPSTAELSGRLLYSVANMDDRRWELWEYNFATGESTKIGDWDTEIDVNADGSRIVYYAWPKSAGEDAGIWIMDGDFSNHRLVIQGGAYPSFSPDSNRLVLNGGRDIYVINQDGSGLRPLTRGEYPAWSPVSNQVAHRACVGGDCGIWIIDANAQNPNARHRITTGGSDGQPAWSPDGSRIAYISQEDGNFEIYVISADGADKRRLTENVASDGLPTWSPDGQWIAFRSDRGGAWAIYAMRPDGSDMHKIIDADVLPLWFFEKMHWR